MAGRALTILAIVVVIGAAVGVLLIRQAPTAVDEEAAARTVVEAFGTKLQQVSLMAPQDAVARAMQEHYGPYVAPALLSDWQNNPPSAPGRLMSSPWPDRIDIASVQKEAGPRYVFEGDIVEVTNEGGGIGEEPTEAARRPVVVTVEKVNGSWLITQVKVGPYPGDGEWLYSDTTSQGFQFMYPSKLPTTFISAQEWPPLVEKTANKYSCKEGEITAADGPLKTAKKHIVGDREYCVTVWSDAAAGSMYTNYDYSTKFGDAVYRVVFTLRFPQCMNYDEPQQSACKAEQSSFNIDGLVDRIAQSIRM